LGYDQRGVSAGRRANIQSKTFDKHTTGYSGKDNILPPRVMQKLLDLSDDEQKVPVSIQDQLQEYYTLRGWDKEGIPTQEKLLELQFM